MPVKLPLSRLVVPASAPVTVHVALVLRSVPAPRSCTLAMPEKVPDRLVVVPALGPVIVVVALLFLSVPTP